MVEIFVFIIMKNFAVIKVSEAYEVTKAVEEIKSIM